MQSARSSVASIYHQTNHELSRRLRTRTASRGFDSPNAAWVAQGDASCEIYFRRPRARDGSQNPSIFEHWVLAFRSKKLALAAKPWLRYRWRRTVRTTPCLQSSSALLGRQLAWPLFLLASFSSETCDDVAQSVIGRSKRVTSSRPPQTTTQGQRTTVTLRIPAMNHARFVSQT